MRHRRPRILVSVEPPLLGELLCRLLEGAGQDDVVGRAPDELHLAEGHFDGAVVTGSVLGSLRADVIIQLPGDQTSEEGRVIGPLGATPALVDGIDAVIHLLDRHCSALRSRHRVLTTHSRDGPPGARPAR
jgi:hypothetical protein